MSLALNGKEKEAMALLEQDVYSGNSLYADDMLMVSSLKKSSIENALELAMKSYDKYDGPSELLPELIAMNKQQRNQFEVIKYYGLCVSRVYRESNSSLLDDCNKAKEM